MADTSSEAKLAAHPGVTTNGADKKTFERPQANPNAVEIVKLAGGKPDPAANTAELDKLSKDIESVQKELNQVRSLLSGSGPSKDSPAGIKRTQLRDELDQLRSQQAGSKGSRGKTLDDLRALQEGISKKIKDLQQSKSKAPYKSTADVDGRIQRLEQQVEAGSMKLVEEKKALNEISQLKKSRKTVESFDHIQSQIDADKIKVEELRASLDSPEAKALNKRYDEIKTELDSIQQEQDKTAGSRSKLLTQRTELSGKLDALYQGRRDRQAAFRAASDAFYVKLNAEREKRAQKQREDRALVEADKRREHEQTLREEAAMPAFASEIEDCDVLINYFSKGKKSDEEQQAEQQKVTAGKALNLRQVNADAMVPKGAFVKQKTEDEDTYFVGAAAKGKRQKGKNKRGTPLNLDGADEENTAAAGATGDKLNVPLGTLSALLALSIPPPTNSADVPRVIENLKLKRQYFTSNQARITKENIAKVEKMLAKTTINTDAASVEKPE